MYGHHTDVGSGSWRVTRHCKRSSGWAMALRLLGLAVAGYMAWGADAFGLAFSASAQNGKCPEASQLLVRMAGFRVEVDALACKEALQACGLVGDWSAAVEVVDAMVDSSIELDVLACSRALRACIPGGAWQGALHLLGVMAAASVQVCRTGHPGTAAGERA